MSINEDVITTYIDLDNLIETCGLTVRQRFILEELMSGGKIQDVANFLKIDRKTLSESVDSSIEKIVRKNNEIWEACFRQDTPLFQ